MRNDLSLSSVKKLLQEKYANKGVEIIGNDRIVVLTEEEISTSLQSSIIRDCPNFAIVFFTKQGYSDRMKLS